MKSSNQTNGCGERAPEAAAGPVISDAQRRELLARLAYHRENPNDPGITFEQLKAELKRNE